MSNLNTSGYVDHTAMKALQSISVDEYNKMIDSQMSEDEHQIRFFGEVEKLTYKHPELIDVYHVPNGELRAKATAGKLRAMGVKPGIPDICVPIARNGYHALYIELKSLKKHAKLSENQGNVINRLRNNGYRVEVCRGWREALRALTEYLEEQG